MSRGGYTERNSQAGDRREAQHKLAAAQRNAGTPRGRPVSTGDVSAYALAGHAKCGGSGMLGPQMACPCATKRFLKRHPEVVVVIEGGVCGVYWPLSAISVEPPKEDP